MFLSIEVFFSFSEDFLLPFLLLPPFDTTIYPIFGPEKIAKSLIFILFFHNNIALAVIAEQTI